MACASARPLISINRATSCFGASFAGAITGLVAGTWGWRAAVMVPGVIDLLAIYVRATCPESPHWVRTQDRKRRIAAALAAGGTLSAEDRAWYTKADKVGIRQVFMPYVLPATLVTTFVACCSCCIYGTVGAWIPLHLSIGKHWSTAQYITFYVFWGLIRFFGLCVAGRLAVKVGRRVGFIALLIWGAVFVTLWVYGGSNLWLWIFGLAWSFLGSWGSGARARRSPPRSSRLAFAASPTVWCGS